MWCETKKTAECGRARTEQAPAPFASKVKQPAKWEKGTVSPTGHLPYMTDEMAFKFPIPLTLEVDNQTAIHFSKGSTKHSKMKHIDARQSWVEALCDDTIMKFDWVPTTENLADLNSSFLTPLDSASYETVFYSHALFSQSVVLNSQRGHFGA